MDDPLPTEGGAANTPPFPRLHTERDPDSGQPRPSNRDNPAEPFFSSEATDSGADLSFAPADTEAAANEPYFAPSAAGTAPGEESEDDDAAGRPALSDALHHTLDGARRDARRLADRAAEAARRRADRTVRRGFDRAADRLYDTADRIDRAAEDRLGADGPPVITNAAQGTVEWIEGVAEYLRSSDIGTVQQDLERRVREKPLQTILLAASAGWVVGRLMRR